MILDTNAISAWAAGDPAATVMIEAAERIHLPVVVLGEFRYGLMGSRFRDQLEMRLNKLERVAPILPVTRETASVYSTLRYELKQAGRPIPENDVWIAALSRQHGLSVLSRDKHFDYVSGLRRMEW